MRRHICHTPVRLRVMFGARVGGVAGVLSLAVCHKGATATASGGCSRVAGARRRPPRRDGGSTRGTRGGDQWAGAVGVRARVAAQRCWRSPQRSRPCCLADAGDKRRKNHVSQICRPFCFRPQFLLSLLEGIQNERARLLTGRCCTLNSHWLYRLLSFVLRQNR